MSAAKGGIKKRGKPTVWLQIWHVPDDLCSTWINMWGESGFVIDGWGFPSGLDSTAFFRNRDFCAVQTNPERIVIQNRCALYLFSHIHQIFLIIGKIDSFSHQTDKILHFSHKTHRHVYPLAVEEPTHKARNQRFTPNTPESFCAKLYKKKTTPQKSSKADNFYFFTFCQAEWVRKRARATENNATAK